MTGLTARTKTTALIVATVVLLIADRLLKYLALHTESVQNIFGNWFTFSLSHNTGIAFSLADNYNVKWVIVLITLVLLLFVYLKLKTKKYNEAIALSIILLGSVSNLYDRFIYGSVIDYFSFANLSVFNIADCLIIAGAILFIIFNRINENGAVDKNDFI